MTTPICASPGGPAAVLEALIAAVDKGASSTRVLATSPQTPDLQATLYFYAAIRARQRARELTTRLDDGTAIMDGTRLLRRSAPVISIGSPPRRAKVYRFVYAVVVLRRTRRRCATIKMGAMVANPTAAAPRSVNGADQQNRRDSGVMGKLFLPGAWGRCDRATTQPPAASLSRSRRRASRFIRLDTQAEAHWPAMVALVERLAFHGRRHTDIPRARRARQRRRRSSDQDDAQAVRVVAASGS